MLQRRPDIQFPKTAPDGKLQHTAGLRCPYREIVCIARKLFLEILHDLSVIEVEDCTAARTKTVDFITGNFAFKNIIYPVPELILLFTVYDNHSAALHIIGIGNQFR